MKCRISLVNIQMGFHHGRKGGRAFQFDIFACPPFIFPRERIGGSRQGMSGGVFTTFPFRAGDVFSRGIDKNKRRVRKVPKEADPN